MTTQFEWAWQNPKKSRRLRHVANKMSKEKGIDFCFRVLSAMLNVGPWNRLPLKIRWLKQEYKMEFDVEQQPPIHMPIVYGPLNKRKPKKGNNGGGDEVEEVNSTSYRCVECSKKIKVYNVQEECNKFGTKRQAGDSCSALRKLLTVLCAKFVVLHQEPGACLYTNFPLHAVKCGGKRNEFFCAIENTKPHLRHLNKNLVLFTELIIQLMKRKKMRKLTSFCWFSMEHSWVVKFFSFSSPSNLLPRFIFFQDVSDSISCINSSCPMKAHLVCLAKRFLQTNREDSFLIPVEGDCPTCSSTFLWRDLIKHDNQTEQTSDPNSDSPHWTEELNRYWKTKLLSSIVVHNLHLFFPLFHFSPLWETWHLRFGPENSMLILVLSDIFQMGLLLKTAIQTYLWADNNGNVVSVRLVNRKHFIA